MEFSEKVILEKKDIDKIINRLVEEIKNRNTKLENLAFIGIRRRGVPIARRIAKRLSIGDKEIPVGALDITLYRDDLSEVASQPLLKKTEIPFSVKDRDIILCDDVIYTGRTVRAALDGIIDLGRPRTIQLVVILDRGQRELPIQPDFVGKTIKVKPDELVEVTPESIRLRKKILDKKYRHQEKY